MVSDIILNLLFQKRLKSISKKWEYLGWFLPVAVFMILIYYSAILGWDGFYVIISAFKGWGADPNAYFTGSFLQANDTLGGLGTFCAFCSYCNACRMGYNVGYFPY